MTLAVTNALAEDTSIHWHGLLVLSQTRGVQKRRRWHLRGPSLQWRVEFNLAAQDIPGSEIGAGLSDVQAGLRLRYEIAREFAPYVGIA